MSILVSWVTQDFVNCYQYIIEEKKNIFIKKKPHTFTIKNNGLMATDNRARKQSIKICLNNYFEHCTYAD